MTDQSRNMPTANGNAPPATVNPPQSGVRKPYITHGGASDAGRNLRHQDPKIRSEAAKYMADYRRKKKQTK